jgi:hypothetical protein
MLVLHRRGSCDDSHVLGIQPSQLRDGLFGHSVANVLQARAISSLEFELSGVRFRQSAYIVSNGEEPLFDGLLGVRSLGVRVLSLDANRRILYLLK